MTVCLILSLVTATGCKRVAGMDLFPIEMAAVGLTESPFAHPTPASASWVVTAGRTADQDVVSFGGLLREGKCLQVADCRSVNSDEESDVRVADQALVTQQRHLLGLGGFDDAHGFVRIMRHENQGLDAGIQQLPGLPQL